MVLCLRCAQGDERVRNGVIQQNTAPGNRKKSCVCKWPRLKCVSQFYVVVYILVRDLEGSKMIRMVFVKRRHTHACRLHPHWTVRSVEEVVICLNAVTLAEAQCQAPPLCAD